MEGGSEEKGQREKGQGKKAEKCRAKMPCRTGVGKSHLCSKNVIRE